MFFFFFFFFFLNQMGSVSSALPCLFFLSFTSYFSSHFRVRLALALNTRRNPRPPLNSPCCIQVGLMSGLTTINFLFSFLFLFFFFLSFFFFNRTGLVGGGGGLGCPYRFCFLETESWQIWAKTSQKEVSKLIMLSFQLRQKYTHW